MTGRFAVGTVSPEPAEPPPCEPEEPVLPDPELPHPAVIATTLASASAVVMPRDQPRTDSVLIAVIPPCTGNWLQCPCGIVDAWSGRQAIRTRRPRPSWTWEGACVFCCATTSSPPLSRSTM